MRYLLCITALTAMLALSSCSNAGGEAEHVVREWIGREFVFPDSMTFVVQGDTVDYHWQDADYKIVTYVDSAGCTECKMKLPMWLYTYETLQSEADVALMMIIANTDTASVLGILRLHDFPLPVCIDVEDSIGALNPIPASYDFRTFLLDADNRVIAVGNPVTNRDIQRLYRERTGCLTHTVSGPVAADRYSANIGVIESPVTTDFELKNISDSAVVVSKILTSCDCTTAEISNDTILPGKTAMLLVTLKPDTISGEFEKEVNVYFKGSGTFETFMLRGFMP